MHWPAWQQPNLHTFKKFKDCFPDALQETAVSREAAVDLEAREAVKDEVKRMVRIILILLFSGDTATVTNATLR